MNNKLDFDVPRDWVYEVSRGCMRCPVDKIPYTTTKGVSQFRPRLTEAEYHDSDNAGFCLACGSEASGVEPDARRYPCGACREHKVYGLEELLMMGLVELC